VPHRHLNSIPPRRREPGTRKRRRFHPVLRKQQSLGAHSELGRSYQRFPDSRTIRRRRLRAPSSAELDSASEMRARCKEAAPFPSPSPETAIPPHVPRTRFCLTDTRLWSGPPNGVAPLPDPSPLGPIFCPLRDTEAGRPPLSRGPDSRSGANLTRRTHFHRSDAHFRAAANNTTAPLPAIFPRAAASASEPDMIKVIHRFIFALFSHV